MTIPNIDPIVSIPMVTPFNQKDEVDFSAIEYNLSLWMKTNFSGLVIGTASGEENFLNEKEKLNITSVVSSGLKGDRFIIGGIDCPSVYETLRKAEDFAKAGAELVRLRIPREESIIESYFSEVLASCPLPVLMMHQCNPELFGIAGRPATSPQLIGDLCKMDGIFGYCSDHDIRFETQVRKYVPNNKRFWICNGSLALTGTFIGCNGITTAIANVLPNALFNILKKGIKGSYEKVQDIQTGVQAVDSVMLPYKSSGIKAAMNLLGFRGTIPRRPCPPMPISEVQKLKKVLKKGGFIPPDF